jgi:hypothetical protein
MQEVINWLTALKADAALAGAAGGVVRWATLRDDWKTGAIAILVGAICATYLAGPAIHALEASLVHFGARVSIPEKTAGFLVGIGGVTITGFILDVAKAFRERKGGPDVK